MINTLQTSGAVRAPRALVRINDRLMPWIDWEVNNNGFYQADTFDIKIAISQLSAPYDLAWLLNQTSLKVEILAGFPSNADHFTASELDLLVLGMADEVVLKPETGMIGMTGRDLTSLFIDAKTTEKWPNQRASTIAETLAKKHGLTASVVATTAKVGTYYDIDHVHLMAQRTEWDLLTFLAHREGYTVYVSGKTLHFEPAAALGSDPYVLQWTQPAGSTGYASFNGSGLMLSRNLTLAKDIIVEVRSWNAKRKTGFTKTATATHSVKTAISGLPQPVGKAQTFTYIIPGLTPEQALQRAQAILKQLSQHELKLGARLPGDNILTPRVLVELRGTGTVFDQTYYVDQVVRSMSIETGYVMRLRAKNHPTNSEILA